MMNNGNLQAENEKLYNEANKWKDKFLKSQAKLLKKGKSKHQYFYCIEIYNKNGFINRKSSEFIATDHKIDFSQDENELAVMVLDYLSDGESFVYTCVSYLGAD